MIKSHWVGRALTASALVASRLESGPGRSVAVRNRTEGTLYGHLALILTIEQPVA